MRTLTRSLLFAAALFSASVFAQAQKRPITDKDLFDFHWIGDVQVAPDGHAAIYVEATTTPDRSNYQTSLYLLDLTAPGATPQLLTPGGHDSSPRWSPDSKQIAFVRSPDRSAAAAGPSPSPSPSAQVYLMPAVLNGTVIKISELPKGAGDPMWTPSGNALVVSSSTPQDQAKARTEAAKLGPRHRRRRPRLRHQDHQSLQLPL